MDYSIGAMDVLLQADCILPGYVPLVRYKEKLLENLRRQGIRSKSACMTLSDEALLAAGLPDEETVRLFRRFLVMYDVKAGKLKEIDSVAADEAEAAVFRALYLLPGVKAVRAGLYRRAGYDCLRKIAAASPEEILRATAEVIRRECLVLKAPLPKEIRTHIAVAKALVDYPVQGEVGCIQV